MKILQFLKENSLFDSETFTYPEFLDGDLRSMLDGLVLSRFGFRELQDRVKVFSEEAEWDIPATVQFLVYSLSIEKEYKWKTLLETEHFEYNPIENYDRNEHEEITRSKGSQENATVYGATSETVAEGAHTDTTTYGATSATTADTTHTDETTNTVSAENSSVYQPSEKSETQYGATSTTATSTSHEDSTAFGAKSTTTSGTTHTDTFSEGSREDGEERDLRVHGNIGTVTGQDMIKQQREIADFDALLEIAHDIVLEIGKGVL